MAALLRFLLANQDKYPNTIGPLVTNFSGFSLFPSFEQRFLKHFCVMNIENFSVMKTIESLLRPLIPYDIKVT